MKLSDRARHSPTSLRKLIALLMLAFALVTISHAGHRHDASGPGSTHSVCDYCATFGSLADVPVHANAPLPRPEADAPLAFTSTGFVSSKIRTAAQPRAPPSC